MENEEEISVLEILNILWRKMWLIILFTILGAGVGFGISNFTIDPTYSSSISMYVNNDTDRLDSYLNINDINASQKLAGTYIEILKSDMVLDSVIDKIQLPYTNRELYKMITANSLNDTEILVVKVVSKDPYEAANIANTIAEVAPSEIVRVVNAGGVQIIDRAVPNQTPIAPNIKMITVLGGCLGALMICFLIIVISMLDTGIKSYDDLIKQYEIPVLGVIPNILEVMKSKN